MVTYHVMISAHSLQVSKPKNNPILTDTDIAIPIDAEPYYLS